MKGGGIMTKKNLQETVDYDIDKCPHCKAKVGYWDLPTCDTCGKEIESKS
jgi:predicted amidophosphoribosyltransferase